MRWTFPLICLLLPLCLAIAQDEPPPAEAQDPLQLLDDVRILQVARDLQLREDQIPKIIPLINQALERVAQRDAALDGIWAQAAATMTALDQALLAGRQPPRGAEQAAERVVAQHDQVRAQADRDLEKIADQLLAQLDPQQVARVETLQMRQALQQGEQQSRTSTEIAGQIAQHAAAMRQLRPEEYAALRVPMALELATLLVPPNDRLYNRAVGDVLRITDSIRRATDAEFAQVQPQLAINIARELGLPEAPRVEQRPISFGDLMLFVSSDRTVPLLTGYKANPAMEVVE